MIRSPKKYLRLITISLAAALLAACGAVSNNSQPTAVELNPTVIELTATEVPATATAVSSNTAVPPTATSAPTETSIPPTETLELTATIPPTATPLPPLSGSGGGVIAYVSEREGTAGIQIMNADGTDQRRLSHAFDAHPSWSPDGSRIAFTTSPGGRLGIAVIDLAAGEITYLTDDERGPAAPDWSPDGDGFAYIYHATNPGTTFELYLMDAAGKHIKRLTESAGLVTYDNPDWSPDGHKLTFSSDLQGNQDIYVADADGSNVLQLTSNEVDDRSPVWSPDGSKIAFESYRGGNWDIFVMNADGSGVQNFSNSPDRELWPSWSPDGGKIVFQSDRDGNWEIYVMNADGTEPQRLTDNDVKDSEPSWRP